MTDLQATLDHVDDIADWLLAGGEVAADRGDLEATLKLVQIAAAVLSRQNRTLVSPRAESLLRRVAASAAVSIPAADLADLAGSQRGCLHVLSEALPAGGLTAMALRWIRNDLNAAPHYVALLSQRIPAPDELMATVALKHGAVLIADPDESLLERARWLRTLANALATHVVLHVDVSDVVSAAAFGADGGPPVMLVNHSAHAFWTGASIADLVVNCRGSQLETSWTSRYRGVQRYATVPIPLAAEANSKSVTVSDRGKTKLAWSIAEDAIVILTMGASFKYLPSNGLDFVATCRDILRLVPNAVLLAIGVTPDARWSAASEEVSGRMRALGVLSRSDVSDVQGIADVYVEGFPFGTTTALVEACARGVPSVLAPAECPPPYASDGIALDGTLERPRSVQDFQRRVVALCSDADLRRSLGTRVQRTVHRHHCNPGWQKHLNAALEALPSRHRVAGELVVQRTPDPIHEYWTRFVAQWGGGYLSLLENVIADLMQAGQRVVVPQAMALNRQRACRDRHGVIPFSWIVFMSNVVLPVVTTRFRLRIFRLVCFVGRGSVISRLLAKIARDAKGAVQGSPWYEEYRQRQR